MWSDHCKETKKPRNDLRSFGGVVIEKLMITDTPQPNSPSNRSERADPEVSVFFPFSLLGGPGEPTGKFVPGRVAAPLTRCGVSMVRISTTGSASQNHGFHLRKQPPLLTRTPPPRCECERGEPGNGRFPTVVVLINTELVLGVPHA